MIIVKLFNGNDLAHCERQIPVKIFMGIIQYSVPSKQYKRCQINHLM